MSTAVIPEFRKPQGRAVDSAGEMYYLQNRGYVGNCLIWWKQGGHGYTCDLLKAWRVTKAEAERICRSRPKEDIAWPVSKAEALVQWHVVGNKL